MEIIQTDHPDVFLLKPVIYFDERGCFCENFRESIWRDINTDISFVQENESKSTLKVFRGLHFQRYPYAQSKLVRVVSGKIVDYIVDLRNNSPYFGKTFKFELSESNGLQLFVPKGFAHGFLALSDNTKVSYKVDEYYNPEYDSGINPYSNHFSILKELGSVIISEKDKSLEYFDINKKYF